MPYTCLPRKLARVVLLPLPCADWKQAPCGTVTLERHLPEMWQSTGLGPRSMCLHHQGCELPAMLPCFAPASRADHCCELRQPHIAFVYYLRALAAIGIPLSHEDKPLWSTGHISLRNRELPE